MQLNTDNLQEICEVAIIAAKKASHFISVYDMEKLDVQMKPTDSCKQPIGGSTLASQVVTEVDIKSQDIILQEIEAITKKYDFGLLTEEIQDDQSRFTKDYFWCIDPLDGTLPYTQGKEGYSVSIALVAQDGTPIIGVVCNPITQDIYSAIKGVGVFKNNRKWVQAEPMPNAAFTFINDRSFYKHPNYKSITTSLYFALSKKGHAAFKMKKQGGAVMNAIWVLENQPACYFKLPKKEQGGGSVWDFAATSCIFNELGLKACNFSGELLPLNSSKSTFMNTEGVFYAAGINLEEVRQIAEDAQLAKAKS
ncbi:3'(2'),5'-bisphosphate nucleotidase CysQ family protein [Labilibacter marinus]|uniref:3'(2'),5'-bisphosphate nucleotidase CysQ family protein n=1 Tax=Labilibacter marinus TaxID=1477105 RepID=UPI00083191F5|nr:inositol monophosphatase family protein [Labilibacter marinus]